MSNPGASKLELLTVTGNPKVDAMIRYGLVALCASITGMIIGWLNSHGFNDPNLYIYVPTGVATVLITVVTALWGIIKASKNEAIVQLREAIAMQAGLNVAAHPEAETPVKVTVEEAQTLIAQHATPIAPDTK